MNKSKKGKIFDFIWFNSKVLKKMKTEMNEFENSYKNLIIWV